MEERIELLAPVGSMEALYAAVENGANAVYLGGKLFNARHYASNFDDEALREAVRYAHIRHVKVYITLNILLDEHELHEVMPYLAFLYSIDVDALIVQDLGLARLIHRLLPDFELHASTQMTIYNHMGVNFLEEIGFKRAVLAREVGTAEIRFIKDHAHLELEAFIHGALCISYSGQCLMSSMIGGRSGNRGRCAQPCRMTYSIVDLNNGKILKETIEEQHLLSPRDLNTIEALEEVIQSGITSLKIEGRMKRPEYVATIVEKYRKKVDQILKVSNDSITKQDLKEMAQIFNRGFTKGFILNTSTKELMSTQAPNNRGVSIGQVIGMDNGWMTIKLDGDLRKGDGIRVLCSKGEDFGKVVERLFLGSDAVDYAEAGRTVRIRSKHVPSIGDQVMKTSDIALLERAKASYQEQKNKFGIYMAMTIEIDRPLTLHAWDDDGHYIEVVSDEVAERGIRTQLSEEKVRKQMEKLGDTPYVLKNMELNLQEAAMVPVSVLNKLRREAIKNLDEERGKSHKRPELDLSKVKGDGMMLLQGSPTQGASGKRVAIKLSTEKQFKALDLTKVHRIYFENYRAMKKAILKAKEQGVEVYLSTERIIESEGFEAIGEAIEAIGPSHIDGVSVSNVGALKFIKDHYTFNIHGDIGLNAFNSLTVNSLADYGVSSLTLSPELKLSQIRDIMQRVSIPCDVVGYGRLPVMVLKYCPLSEGRGCNREGRCDGCHLREGYGLKDRKGMIFPMVRQGNYTIVYNSQPIIILKDMDGIVKSGISGVRLDFTTEEENVSTLQSLYYDSIEGGADAQSIEGFLKAVKEDEGYTKGHFFRGVL